MATRYVALLRGINVGGANIIKMTDLKACFESLGAEDVSTFIASGNVLFTAPGRGTAEKLTAMLEAGLKRRFAYEASLMLRSPAQMQAIVDERPKGFGDAPAKYRYDVLFLKGVEADDVIAQLEPKQGVDGLWAGDGVVYASRLIAKATSSRLSRVATLPVYQQMTLRNWNTTRKLAELLKAP
jgi:uncharacterized protein (DUF1697 family)